MKRSFNPYKKFILNVKKDAREISIKNMKISERKCRT